MIYGRNPVYEALKRDRVTRIFYSPSSKGLDKILTLAKEKRIPITQKKSKNRKSQGIMAEVKSFSYAKLSEINLENAFLVALDHLTDPMNFGAIIRSAHAFGADAIIIPERGSVDVTPTVSKASAGAIEHIRIVKVVNIPNTINLLKKKGVTIVGLSEKAKDSIQKYKYPSPVCFVIGSEGEGLQRLTESLCDPIGLHDCIHCSSIIAPSWPPMPIEIEHAVRMLFGLDFKGV